MSLATQEPGLGPMGRYQSWPFNHFGRGASSKRSP